MLLHYIVTFIFKIAKLPYHSYLIYIVWCTVVVLRVPLNKMHYHFIIIIIIVIIIFIIIINTNPIRIVPGLYLQIK